MLRIVLVFGVDLLVCLGFLCFVLCFSRCFNYFHAWLILDWA